MLFNFELNFLKDHTAVETQMDPSEGRRMIQFKFSNFRDIAFTFGRPFFDHFGLVPRHRTTTIEP